MPFLALRSYLPADHPDKALEMGSEATPGQFIDALLDVVEACDRVLAPHGSICIELGDTYAGSDTRVDSVAPDPKFPKRPGVRTATAKAGGAWPLDKSLCLIPELFRVALVYGFNPLTGRTTPRWRARNVIRWCRPNPPVGALGDKVRPATSDMVVICHARDRYFDLDAVRTPPLAQDRRQATYEARIAEGPRSFHDHSADSERGRTQPLDIGGGVSNPAGAPPLDHWWHDDFDQDAWLIPTQPYKSSHYATWPQALCVKPIEAMCPRKVCTTCGQPSRRIVQIDRIAEADDTQRITKADAYRLNGHDQPPEIGWEMSHTTIGWTECGHGAGCRATTWKTVTVETVQGCTSAGDWVDMEDWDVDEEPVASRVRRKRRRVVDDLGVCADRSHWRPGVVLDPFGGSGTTGQVATGHGRDAILVDIDDRNVDLAVARIGPLFLTVEHPVVVEHA